MMWLALGLTWLVWAVLTIGSIVDARRHGRGSSSCATVVLPIVISVAILAVGRMAPRYVLWTPIAVIGLLVVATSIPILISIALQLARKKNR